MTLTRFYFINVCLNTKMNNLINCFISPLFFYSSGLTWLSKISTFLHRWFISTIIDALMSLDNQGGFILQFESLHNFHTVTISMWAATPKRLCCFMDSSNLTNEVSKVKWGFLEGILSYRYGTNAFWLYPTLLVVVVHNLQIFKFCTRWPDSTCSSLVEAIEAVWRLTQFN